VNSVNISASQPWSRMTVNVELFLWLLILYQFKHFFADFVFQNVWMLQKSLPGWNFVAPLAIHCGIHALGTFAVAIYLNPSLWYLGVLDFVIHFVVDRLKAGPRYLDQMVHHLTHIYICWALAAG
jgi:hypothetical protein